MALMVVDAHPKQKRFPNVMKKGRLLLKFMSIKTEQSLKPSLEKEEQQEIAAYTMLLKKQHFPINGLQILKHPLSKLGL